MPLKSYSKPDSKSSGNSIVRKNSSGLSSNKSYQKRKEKLKERIWESPFPESISLSLLRSWVKNYSTPFYVYDLATLKRRIGEVKDFAIQKHILLTGFTPRYAIKANPNLALLKLFHHEGIAFDASSEYEVDRILRAKIPAQKILLTAQQVPRNQEMFRHYFDLGLEYNAGSLRQVEWFGKLCPGQEVSLRINPGFGSGMDTKTTVGGKESGFGIWYEYLPEAKKLLKKYNLSVKRIHTHVGSGSDSSTWKKVCATSLKLLEHFPEAYVLNIGGGFKISRTPENSSANLSKIANSISNTLLKYLERTKRKLHFEIEPGTYYIAEAGLLIARVEDIITTGNLRESKNIIRFIKLNCGMNDIIRPTLYQSRHHIDIVPLKQLKKTSRMSSGKSFKPYLVIGHCCESGDLLSQPLSTKPNSKKATFNFNHPEIGDIAIIHGAGAYGSAMSSRYNSFPLAGEYLFQGNNKPLLTIRRPETFEDVVKNESLK